MLLKKSLWINDRREKPLRIIARTLTFSATCFTFIPPFGVENLREVDGTVLEFEDGLVVDYSAEKGQDYLEQILRVPGVNRLNKIGIGANYAHQSSAKKI